MYPLKSFQKHYFQREYKIVLMPKIFALFVLLTFTLQAHSNDEWQNVSVSPLREYHPDGFPKSNDSLTLTIRKIYLEANKANQR
jgi:hypothetical protein